MPAHRTKPAVCIMDGCDEAANRKGTARGYCTAHYWRIVRTGFAECFVDGCHQPIGKYGQFGMCASHVKELVA